MMTTSHLFLVLKMFMQRLSAPALCQVPAWCWEREIKGSYMMFNIYPKLFFSMEYGAITFSFLLGGWSHGNMA